MFRKLILILSFLTLPLFGYAQILDESTIIKKRDSLNTIITHYNNKKSIYFNQLDSLKKEKYKETHKRVPNTNQINILNFEIKNTENKIYFTNKQINNNIRLIRRYPLPSSFTPKPRNN